MLTFLLVCGGDDDDDNTFHAYDHDSLCDDDQDAFERTHFSSNLVSQNSNIIIKVDPNTPPRSLFSLHQCYENRYIFCFESTTYVSDGSGGGVGGVGGGSDDEHAC